MFLQTVAAAAPLHDELFDDVGRFRRIQADLDVVLRTVDTEQVAVRSLEDRWVDLVATAFRGADDYDGLLARLPPDDPARTTTGLLEFLGQPRRETLHTAAIGSLLGPDLGGGTARLRAFLELALARACVDMPSPASIAAAKIAVETSYTLRAGRKTLYPTPDLRIEVGRLVVVVENKIDALDREDQLSSYRDAARAHHGDAEFVFVYLTPAGDSPSQEDAEEWIPLSYRDLTLRWRSVLAADGREGRTWPDAARAYLSTLTCGICNWRVGRPLTRAERATVVPYLRAATGGHYE
jgi:hypothetical protein